MALSALIHKNKSKPVATATLATPATHDREKVVTVANVASVAVANTTESKNPQLLVIVWTPTGNQMQVEARDDRHAAFLIRMNPKPLHPITDQETGGDYGEA